MSASPEDKFTNLLAKILESVRSSQERLAQIERDSQTRALVLCNDALAEPIHSPTNNLAFRNAASVIAAMSAPQYTNLARNHRLAQIFRSGNMDAISAELELTGSAEVLDMAKKYFDAVGIMNVAEAAEAISAVRHLLADQIAKGVWLVLKPAFKQEYDVFKRDCLARDRAVAPSTGECGKN